MILYSSSTIKRISKSYIKEPHSGSLLQFRQNKDLTFKFGDVRSFMLKQTNNTCPNCGYVSIGTVIPCLAYIHNTLYSILGIRMQYSTSNPNSKAVHKIIFKTRNEGNPTKIEHHELGFWQLKIMDTQLNNREPPG